MLHGHADRDLWESVGDFLGHVSVGRVPQSRCVCVCVFECGGSAGGTHTEVLDVYRACRRERERGLNDIQDYSTSLADASISSLF